MSIMIIYGNNKTASILTDCRATCTMPDSSIQYYEKSCKVRKFNKTIIGIIGDGNYADKIYESIKNSFNDTKSFINAKFEDLYELCIKYSQQYKNDFLGLGCMIGITGINKNNQIVLDYFHTNEYKSHTMILMNTEYKSKVFCNYDEPAMDQIVYQIVNNTKENMISIQLHNMILENVVPLDNTVNKNYCIETISL